MTWLLVALPVSVAVGGEIWLRRSRKLNNPSYHLPTSPLEDR